jgi:hypothetical protein
MIDVPCNLSPHSTEAIHTIIENHPGMLTSRQRVQFRKAIKHLFRELVAIADVPTYAQIKHGFWYKVLFFTPYGVIKTDTGNETFLTSKEARFLVRTQDLRLVPLTAVLENWDTGDFWSDGKPISTLLLETWRQERDRYYGMRHA